MANEIKNAIEGLAGLLSAIEGLRVYDYPAELREYPCATIQLVERDAHAVAMGRSRSFNGEFLVTVYSRKGAKGEGYHELLTHLEPTGTASIHEAAEADPDWNGQVDEGSLVSVSNIREEPPGSGIWAADLRFRFMKHVA